MMMMMMVGRVVRRTCGTMQQRSFLSFSCGRPLRANLEWVRMSTFDVVHPAFPLPTTASPTFQGDLKEGFGEAVMARDSTESCEFPSQDSCQKTFLWTHKEVELTPLPVVGPVLNVADAKKFPQALGFENQNPFLRVSKQGPCLTAMTLPQHIAQHICGSAD